MSSYKITEGSVKTLGAAKTGLEVTLTSDSGRIKTFYHEIESVDEQVIADTLNALALSFEAEEVVAEATPAIETGKEVEAKEEVKADLTV